MNTISGRYAPKVTPPIAPTSATLLRSCRDCGLTAHHNILPIQFGVALTVCPGCDTKQFKFADWVNDAVRHEVSVRLQGRMQPKQTPRSFKLFDAGAATYV